MGQPVARGGHRVEVGAVAGLPRRAGPVAVTEHQAQAVELHALGALDDLGGRGPCGLELLAGGPQPRGGQLGGQHPGVVRGDGDGPRRHRAALGVVGVQQRLGGLARQHRGELPAEVDRVAHAGVEPVPAPRWVLVRGVAGQEQPSGAVGGGEQRTCLPRVGAEHLDVDLGPDHAAHQRGRVHPGVVRGAPGGDGPPRLVEVVGADHPGEGGVEHPAVQRPPAQQGPQVAGAEDRREVGAPGVAALVAHAHGGPHHAARTVGAHRVPGAHHRHRAALVLRGDGDPVGVLLHADRARPRQQGGAGVVGQRLAQDLLDHGLADLLAGLGRQVVAGQRQAQGAGEAGDLRPDRAGAEDHVTGPAGRDRRPCAHLVGQAPAAEELHRARRGGLGARAHR